MSFPTSFPTLAIPTLIGYLRDAGVSRRTAAEAAYDVAGYGLNIALPVDASALFATAPTESGLYLLSESALAARLQEFQDAVDANPTAAFTLPPWVLPIVLEVLRRLLAG
jgi:hypothetical protein